MGEEFFTIEVKRGIFSRQEIIELIISTFIFFLLLTFINLKSVIKFPLIILLFLLIAVTAFPIHEISHKIVAIRKGLFAAYKIDWNFTLLSIILSIITQRVFMATGAVQIYYDSPYISKKDIRDISAAGPISNMLIGLILIFFSSFFSGFIQSILVIAAKVNFWLALFNLLPIPPLDGSKIAVTDLPFYLILIICAALLTFTF